MERTELPCPACKVGTLVGPALVTQGTVLECRRCGERQQAYWRRIAPNIAIRAPHLRRRLAEASQR